MKMKAIVTGVSGQDGFYMTRELLASGIEVLGLTTNIKHSQEVFKNELSKSIKFIKFNYERSMVFDSILREFEPDFIFNFAAKSTGQGMFDAAYEMSRLNSGFVLDILEAIRKSNRSKDIVFLQASSSEMFGHVSEIPQSEETSFGPKSPYGAAKLYAHNMVGIYRETFGIKCCSAILYNHESTRRSKQFVTMKIANAVAKIKLGLDDRLELGSLDGMRNWGYAPEYVQAMWKMTRADDLDDYVIATGRLHSVRDLCEVAFNSVDLDYHDFVKSKINRVRAIESFDLLGDPSKIKNVLGWEAKTGIKDIINEMVEFEVNRLAK